MKKSLNTPEDRITRLQKLEAEFQQRKPGRRLQDIGRELETVGENQWRKHQHPRKEKDLENHKEDKFKLVKKKEGGNLEISCSTDTSRKH